MTTRTTEHCCFEHCPRAVAEHLGRDVFWPMCAEHAAEYAMPAQGTRRCAAWLDCGRLAVPVAELSFRGFCPSCEEVARS